MFDTERRARLPTIRRTSPERSANREREWAMCVHLVRKLSPAGL